MEWLATHFGGLLVCDEDRNGPTPTDGDIAVCYMNTYSNEKKSNEFEVSHEGMNGDGTSCPVSIKEQRSSWEWNIRYLDMSEDTSATRLVAADGQYRNKEPGLAGNNRTINKKNQENLSQGTCCRYTARLFQSLAIPAVLP